MRKNSMESHQLEQFLALIMTGSKVNAIAAQSDGAGAAAAQARIDRLRDWLIRECEGLQTGAYRELARRIKKRRQPAAKSRGQRFRAP